MAAPEIPQNLDMNLPAVPLLEEATYFRRLATTPGLALVLFSREACATCRIVERRLPLSAPAGVHLFKVDVQVAQALARTFDVFHLPTLLLYVDGHYHARLNCQITPSGLHAAIEHALQHPAEEEP